MACAAISGSSLVNSIPHCSFVEIYHSIISTQPLGGARGSRDKSSEPSHLTSSGVLVGGIGVGGIGVFVGDGTGILVTVGKGVFVGGIGASVDVAVGELV